MKLENRLGAYGCVREEGLQFLHETFLNVLREEGREVVPGVFCVERLLTGHEWSTSRSLVQEGSARRWTLYSVKGGVGRSTTAAVLSWHLARQGERILILDLDLESPGLSSAMLSERSRPTFGIIDWFVEDLVGQSDRLIGEMAALPAWVLDFEGDVRVVPAHGRVPGEYVEKLGRAYMDASGERWTQRLARMLTLLEREFRPTTVLIESRSGLHDVAAATVTDLDAQVLLFAVDTASTWEDYGMIFRHWRSYGLAPQIRDRLSVVSALTPEFQTLQYLDSFRERSWNLFREELYDDLSGTAALTADPFNFALDDEHAPHAPLPVYWTRGLAGGSSLRDLDRAPVRQAYAQFLERFDELASMTVPGER